MNNTVREERLKRKWSQVDLSMMTKGIAPTDISAIENGRKIAFPGWRKRIAQAFGIEEEKLFGEESKDDGVSA